MGSGGKVAPAFPQVLQMMSDKLDWTQKLGDAFLAQQQQVMATVQSLRQKAHEQGNLKSSKEQEVIVEQPAGQTTVIKIEPADPQVVYVPTYNPTVVYGTWAYPAYPPYYYYPPGYVAGTAFFSFAAGVAVGSALWGGCNWHGGDVDINVNRYNQFNKTNIANIDRSKVQNVKWNHDATHRKGVAYRDPATAQRFNKAAPAGAGGREAFRGRAEAGRQDLARGAGSELRDRAPGDRGPADRSSVGQRSDLDDRSRASVAAWKAGSATPVRSKA
jgi:hypothetical protein